MRTGAETLIHCLEELGVEYIFGYPGGAAINLFDALVNSRIELVLCRHEQGAAHMADGYARACRKPGVVLVTSGPGALNTVTGLQTAKMDSAPILVISGQTNHTNLGKDAFQEADVFDITMPAVKHNYLILSVDEIATATHEAYNLTQDGRPGPVLIDLPKDISQAPCPNQIKTALHNCPPQKPAALREDQLSAVVELAKALNQARKPLLLVGQGALIAKAHKEVRVLADKLQAPVTSTLLGKGCFPESHPLSVGMLGMHGTALANYATTECDLILSIGSRFDDRISGKVSDFCPHARIAHIDIDQGEINRIVETDFWICADAREALRHLLKFTQNKENSLWWSQLKAYQKKVDDDDRKEIDCQPPSQTLKGNMVLAEVYLHSQKNAIVTTDVGQHQMWAAQSMLTDFPNCFLSSGGAGTMGFGLPSAIGAQLAHPERQVIAIIGDGGFQMTLCELATAKRLNLPLKIIILDNKYLGMVRQWQEIFYDNRKSGVDLSDNPDFGIIAQAYGVKPFHTDSKENLRQALEDFFDFDQGPALLHVEIEAEENVYPMIPAGKSARDILLRAPKFKLEKPTGST